MLTTARLISYKGLILSLSLVASQGFWVETAPERRRCCAP